MRRKLAIFGDSQYDKNPIEDGQTFFRCILITAED